MLVYDASNNPLITIEWAYPVAECIHILGYALCMGTITVVDLRLLGLALRHQTPAQLLRNTTAWTLIGLAAVLISGPAIFTTDPLMYYYNPAFRWKMLTFLLAVLFHYTVHYKVAKSKPHPLVAKAVGAISLALWISTVAGGIFIAFV